MQALYLLCLVQKKKKITFDLIRVYAWSIMKRNMHFRYSSQQGRM